VIIFLDSSALVKRFIEESGSDKVEKLCMASQEIVVSIISLPEIVSALNRRKREKTISSRQYTEIKERLILEFEDYLSCPFTPEIIESSIRILERFPLRAMDAIHLASATSIPIDLFISADVRQLNAAKQMRLKVKDLTV